ncbi:hypothetical protein KCU91_g16937, partial [Aureobasidium melanogenum]
MATPSTPQAQQPGPSRIVTAVQTGLLYDIGDMSPTSQTNAVHALSNGRMTMVRCYEHDNNFHFELQERIHVTVRDVGAPICSACSDNGSRACRHIYWVDDQILSTAVRPEARSHFKYKISPKGDAVLEPEEEEILNFHNWLREETLGKLARRAGWWKQDPTSQQDTRLVEQTATQILSTFEPSGVLSSQHGQDNLVMLQQESQALFTRYRNEMIKQVKAQPFLLVALGAAVPEAERDLLHLTKIHSRIERIYFDYGYWMTTRTPNHSNLDATAEVLHTEIGHLCSFVREHKTKAQALRREIPEVLQIKTIDILLYTLEQLVEYRGDSQTTAVVSIPQYSGLTLQDRSLLHKMVPPQSQDYFVLPVLKLLSNKVLYKEMVQRRVRTVAYRLREGHEPCPEEYVEELEEIVGFDE